MWLFGPNTTTTCIAYDDNSGNDACARIYAGPLPAGNGVNTRTARVGKAGAGAPRAGEIRPLAKLAQAPRPRPAPRAMKRRREVVIQGRWQTRVVGCRAQACAMAGDGGCSISAMRAARAGAMRCVAAALVICACMKGTSSVSISSA